MKVKIFLFAIVIFGSGIVFLSNASEAAAPQISAQDEARILSSTIQIDMYEFAQEPGGTEAGGQGLGTMVVYGGERLIITHDHWSHLNANLNEVEFRNAMGNLLVTLNAQAFQSLILYRDGGTMVLRVPAGLESIVAAEVGAAAAESDIVWVARRDVETGRQTVEVVPTIVTAVEINNGPNKMKLNSLDDGAVIPGDSGGGVWANGQLIANNWASGIVKKSNLLTELIGVEMVDPSSLVIVALQPLGTQIGINVAPNTDTTEEQTNPTELDVTEGAVKAEMLQETLLD